MKIFDKAQWHIDAGEDDRIVIEKLELVFQFLETKDLLSEDGQELFALGIDSSISLNEQTVTEAGGAFLDQYYDEVINCGVNSIIQELERRYNQFVS